MYGNTRHVFHFGCCSDTDPIRELTEIYFQINFRNSMFFFCIVPTRKYLFVCKTVKLIIHMYAWYRKQWQNHFTSFQPIHDFMARAERKRVCVCIQNSTIGFHENKPPKKKKPLHTQLYENNRAKVR